MVETIDLRVNDNPPGPYFQHLYIVYTNSSGEEFVIRGGPYDDSLNENIDVEAGRYTSASRDWVPIVSRDPSESSLLVSGENLQETFLKIAFFAQLIEESDINYDTLSVLWGAEGRVTNSNTVASAALAAAGITVTAADLPISSSEARVPGFNNQTNTFLPVIQFLNNTHNASALNPAEVYNSMLSNFVGDYYNNLAALQNSTGTRPELIVQCFPRSTLISLPCGKKIPISEVASGTLIASFNTEGDLVSGRVTQLLQNVTDTWLHLSNGTYVTPGHRYLRPDGSFAEIQDIVADDGKIVAADGSIQTVTAEVIRYSAETAHLFEEAEMLVYASEGGAALAPELKRGWKTYNFTVAETHTYIADGIRVHNESVLSSLKAGDVVLSLDEALQNAAVLRDVNGDGRQEVVLLDGVRQPGQNTIIVNEYTYTAPSNITNVAATVRNKMADIDGDTYTINGQTYAVDIYGQLFDPGRGNGPNDGRVSDDMDEMLIDDLGFGRQLTAQNKIYLTTGLTAADVSQAVVGGILYLTITRPDGTRVTENMGTASTISSVNFSNGTSVGYGSLATQINGTAGADNLSGTAAADQMDGLAGNDTLFGLGGNDRLYGSAGTDQLLGGIGNDSLYGGLDNDFLIGGAGADYLDGGAGTSDWAQYDTATAGIRVDLTAPGTNTGDAAGDRFVGIENLFGTAFNDTVRGNTGNNILWGGAGNDSIIGEAGDDALNAGAGTDTLAGGAGNDTYTIDGGDTIIEAANAGTDLVNSSANYALAANVENLTLTGTAAINGSGNALANRLTGNGAANVLNGGTGADTLTGGAGNDVYVTDGGETIIEAANAGVDRVQSSVTLALGLNLENLVLTGTAAINGIGNVLANSITGNAAANTLNGGGGADTLIGGAGNDTYISDGLDIITEAAGAGTDLVQSSGGYTLAANLENLTLIGTAVRGTGNDLANRLTGNASNNVLSGGAGNDTLVGGAGNDTLDGGAGTNTVIYSGTAAVTVNLTNGTATGGEGSDVLSNIDIVRTGNGNDVLVGDANANALSGGAGNDTIAGGAGTDVIAGGAGTDLMRGGAGDGAGDIFIFYAHTDSAVGAGKDIIENFVSGVDRIDLADIDANLAAVGDQGFLFGGTTARANAVWYVSTADGIVVRADINGNTGADFEVLLRGVTSLSGTDFIL